MQKTVIIDIGICNVFNVKRAIEALGVSAAITRSPREVLESPSLVLPGVGAFGAAMQSLQQGGLVEAIYAFANTGKPVLGICLGMQLLMEHSEELGSWEGLGLIPGNVRTLAPPDGEGASFKIPQMGWNTLEPPPAANGDDPWAGTILAGLGRPSPQFYFVHSLVVKPASDAHILASTAYGKDRFCSVIRKDNISACQFHPERSAQGGQQILRNFFKVS